MHAFLLGLKYISDDNYIKNGKQASLKRNLFFRFIYRMLSQKSEHKKTLVADSTSIS